MRHSSSQALATLSPTISCCTEVAIDWDNSGSTSTVAWGWGVVLTRPRGEEKEELVVETQDGGRWRTPGSGARCPDMDFTWYCPDLAAALENPQTGVEMLAQPPQIMVTLVGIPTDESAIDTGTA